MSAMYLSGGSYISSPAYASGGSSRCMLGSVVIVLGGHGVKGTQGVILQCQAATELWEARVPDASTGCKLQRSQRGHGVRTQEVSRAATVCIHGELWGAINPGIRAECRMHRSSHNMAVSYAELEPVRTYWSGHGARKGSRPRPVQTPSCTPRLSMRTCG